MDGFERRKEKSKAKIRRAAGELFNKYGVQRVSVSEIAAAANVSLVTIYNLYGSKDGLVAEWIADFGNKFIERLREVSATDKPYFERVEDTIQAMVEMTESNPALADAALENFEGMAELADSFTAQIRDLFMDFVHTGQKQGYCNPDLSDEAVAAFIEIVVRGMNANAELHMRTHHDAKLFHDLTLIMLFGFGVREGANKGPAHR